MKPKDNFNASEYVNTIDSNYTIVEEYFSVEQLPIMDSIDMLYNTLNLEDILVPLTAIELFEKE